MSWHPPGSHSHWHPPCSGRYGILGADPMLVCCAAPDHAGHHHDRTDGIRWPAREGQRVVPCTWKGCADPMRLEEDGAHYCPGGEAERRYGKLSPGGGS